MNLVIGILGYLILFAGICLFVVIGFAMANILTKTYEVKNASAIVFFITGLLLINCLMLYLSYSRLTNSITSLNFNNFNISSRVGF